MFYHNERNDWSGSLQIHDVSTLAVTANLAVYAMCMISALPYAYTPTQHLLYTVFLRAYRQFIRQIV